MLRLARLEFSAISINAAYHEMSSQPFLVRLIGIYKQSLSW